MFFGIPDPRLQAEIARKVQEQEEILQLMMVLPAYYEYKSNPTYEQVAAFYDEAEAAGYTFNQLYYIFSAGEIPPEVDALIRKHAEHWRPAGEIVESGFPVKSLGGVAALTSALDFKAAMLRIEADAGAATKQLDTLRKSILDMGKSKESE